MKKESVAADWRWKSVLTHKSFDWSTRLRDLLINGVSSRNTLQSVVANEIVRS